ncbi:MAG: hypothetical protein V4492_03320 [Chlamydiota bacterium]
MKFKRLFPLILLFLAACTSPPQTKAPFSFTAFAAPLAHTPERCATPEEEALTTEALAQDYRFLGSGGQCTTFESSDGRFVIKFFKKKAYALPPWVEQFPLQWLIAPLKKSQTKKKKHRKEKAFSAFTLCYDALPAETGLIYMHLSPRSLGRSLNLIGPDQAAYQISLNDYAFVIQKKATLPFAYIGAKIALGDRGGALSAIEALLKLHVQLYQRGIRNRDANFRSNCGFVGSTPIIIDLGRIVYSEAIKKPENYAPELERFLPRLRLWLSSTHPDLLPDFEEIVVKITRRET